MEIIARALMNVAHGDSSCRVKVQDLPVVENRMVVKAPPMFDLCPQFGGRSTRERQREVNVREIEVLKGHASPYYGVRVTSELQYRAT